jgi:replicative DNA helicase
MSLLGSMLLDRDSVGLVLQIIPRNESARLYRPDHRLLFETLIDLYDRNEPIDIIVLEDELRRRGQLDEIGGRDYLIDLSNSVPSTANSEYYARIIRDKSMLRDLIQCTNEIIQAAYDDHEPASNILDDAEQRLFKVTEQRVSHQAVSIRQLLDDTFKQIEAFTDEGMYSGLATGFTELDNLLGGLQYGDFIVIASRPSMGKTSLGLSMLEYIGIVENTPAAFFSMEMSNLQIAQRMLCAKAEVNMNKLRHGKLTDKEITKLQLVCGNMRNCPVFVDDTPGMSVMEVRAKARRLKLMHDIKVVFVDYMQLMYDRVASRENRQQEIATISRGLKALARELGIPIVALAQLNRQVEGRTSNRPRMSDLRESGAIEQDADVVILLHREEYYWDKKKRTEASERYQEIKGKAELIVDKQRNGPTGVVELHFNEMFARFDAAAPRHIREDEVYAGDSQDQADDYDAGMSFEGGPVTQPAEDEVAPF